MLERAVEIARATDGAFDPTVGPLVLLWREARQTARMPDASAIARAREAVGWQRIEFDKSRRAVRLSGPDMRLDLGGIAKGLHPRRGPAHAAGRGCTARPHRSRRRHRRRRRSARPRRLAHRRDRCRQRVCRARREADQCRACDIRPNRAVRRNRRRPLLARRRSADGCRAHESRDCARHRARRCYGRCSGNGVDRCPCW